MDPGAPDPKRPRVMPPGSSSWSALGSHHHGVSSLLNPNPSPTTAQAPHHTPTTGPYQHSPHRPSPHHYSRAPGSGDPHPSHPHHPLPPPPPNAQTPIDDRRHHEPERYPPIQDHRQPPHSPAPAAYPGYASRDHIEKPGLSEDNTLPQIRRPLSTDTMTPATPHSALPPQPYGDEKRHMSYDNAPQQPPMYRQQTYPPQPPMPHGQPYEYAQHPYTPTHDGPPYPIQIAAASGKRKAQRASQACESCRALKAKCDEMKPCKGCKEKKQECRYRESVPKQQDKVQADILETMLAMSQQFQLFNDRMVRMEAALKHVVVPSSLAPTDSLMQDMEERPASAESPAPGRDDAYSSSPGETMPAGPSAPIDTEEARNIARKMQADEEKEVEPGPLVRPGAPTIPPNHTTPASLLLKWPPIFSIAKNYMGPDLIRFIDEFPIRNEEKRGILRLWGRGEGYDGSRADALQDLGSMHVHDDYFESGAPSPSDCWGSINGSPGPDGRPAWQVHLDFSELMVWDYVASFNEHIQNMHPLLIPEELNAMVQLFLASVQFENKKQAAGNPGVAKFVETIGSKRKRSRSPAADAPDSHFVKTKPHFQRSINNAIVLLVLALGKICSCADDRIPEPAPLTPMTPAHAATETPGGPSFAQNGYPPAQSPTQTSPPSYAPYSQSTGGYPASPRDGSSSSRRSSYPVSGGRFYNMPSASAAGLERNMDRIPGLDYFAYATDILGGQMGGFSIRHVHAHILAGLYYGQLGRVIESFAHIKQASWALQTKMRPSMDRYRKLQEKQMSTSDQEQIKDKVDNLLVFAFWSILQLESDIVAELPLPQSHILAFEDIMPYPSIKMALGWGFEEKVLQSYLAQLYLRKNLNQIHQMLYNPENPKPLRQLLEGAEILETIETALDMRFIPAAYKFEHTDPPASDILSARLRAKYWGAHVITFRPFVRQIIEYNFERANISSGDVAMAGISTDNNSLGGPPADGTIEYARKGIRALIESTSAFHGIRQHRFIVTNIFGTAHAQWGNLLTLTASFKDPTLNRFIPEAKLQSLFAKTIAFFKVIAVPSSALEVDLRILEGLQYELWRNRPYSLLPGEVPPPHASELPRQSMDTQAGMTVQELTGDQYQQQQHQQQQSAVSPAYGANGSMSNGTYGSIPPPKPVPPMAEKAPAPPLMSNPMSYSGGMHAPSTPIDMKPNMGRTPLPGPPLQNSHLPPPPIKTEGGASPHGMIPSMHR
ncbi:hypothetical protein QBC43DRAFT_57849 [Cladorrhinum sp. PSN259]|nr:hypothetical protein QBC43DRAFT_57849 [Cladorrhinum sp. PSN259]